MPAFVAVEIDRLKIELTLRGSPHRSSSQDIGSIDSLDGGLHVHAACLYIYCQAANMAREGARIALHRHLCRRQDWWLRTNFRGR